MDITTALQQRKSTRAFLPQMVAPEVVSAILDAARHAPSGVNTQPWQVAVVRGEQLRRLTGAMEQAFRSGERGKMDYAYYPGEWREPYKGRRKACGLQMYQTLQIEREDRQRQQDQWAANYRAFDAPVALFFFIDRDLEVGSWLDYGMFLQSVMLAALDHGVASCPQAALAEYPQIVREQLDYPDSALLVAGMALGYEDTTAVVNSYRTPREAVEQFARFYE